MVDAADPSRFYSQDVLKAIRAMVPSLEDGAFEAQVASLMRHVLHANDLSSTDLAKVTSNSVAETERDLRTLGKALEILRARAEDLGDWDDEPPAAMLQARAAIQPLEKTINLLIHDLELDEEFLEKITTSPAKRSNNHRPFAERILKATAKFWQEAGREINKTRECLAFFEAIVRPIVVDPDIRQACHTSWSEGMVPTFIAKVQKEGREKF